MKHARLEYRKMAALYKMSLTSNISSPLLSVTTASVSPSAMTLDNIPKRDTKRCGVPDCKKKLMLSDVACKCGFRYCGTHRHAEEHKCKFDFRTHGKAQLSATLVKCAGERLPETI